MTIRLINRAIMHCQCDWCGYEWDTFDLPKRCADCKRHTWNGKDLRRRNPAEFIPTGSAVEKLPEVKHKDIVETLMLARTIITQLIEDLGPCAHPEDREPKGNENCVCHEKEVLKKINKQITDLSKLGSTQLRSKKFKRSGRSITVSA